MVIYKLNCKMDKDDRDSIISTTQPYLLNDSNNNIMIPLIKVFNAANENNGIRDICKLWQFKDDKG